MHVDHAIVCTSPRPGKVENTTRLTAATLAEIHCFCKVPPQIRLASKDCAAADTTSTHFARAALLAHALIGSFDRHRPVFLCFTSVDLQCHFQFQHNPVDVGPLTWHLLPAAVDDRPQAGWDIWQECRAVAIGHSSCILPVRACCAQCAQQQQPTRHQLVKDDSERKHVCHSIIGLAQNTSGAMYI